VKINLIYQICYTVFKINDVSELYSILEHHVFFTSIYSIWRQPMYIIVVNHVHNSFVMIYHILIITNKILEYADLEQTY
jgi:hypothetical protein